MTNINIESVWISANAGSGKTTALTARVVRLMLLGASPERICCITYTKAAASEMRMRILGYIRKNLMLADDATRIAHIEKLTGQPATPERIARAQALFGAVLDSSTGGPQITTIHGFCQTLLKRFPIEAGLSPHFTVLEDAAAANLLRRARARLLTGGTCTELAEYLALMGERMGEARFSDHLKAIAGNREKWNEVWRSQTPVTLRARIAQLHGVEGETHDSIDAGLCSWPSEADSALWWDALPKLLEAAPRQGETLARWLAAKAEERRAMLEDFSQIFLTKEGSIRRTIFKKDVMPEGSALQRLVLATAEAAARWFMQTVALSCAEESFAMAMIARALNQHYARLKAEHQALDYDDLITATLRLVATPAMLGWVMEKLDHRIDHLLIDEAQDTSSAQWGIARVLVEELIANAGGIGSGGLPRSLLVVGDEKQSIYSFQGAAPELFQHKKTEFTAMLAGSDAPLVTESLTTSYRSSAAVLQLVDAVANLPDVSPALGAEIAAHQLHHARMAGKVVLHPPIAAPEKPALPPLTIPTEYAVRESGAEQLAKAMLAEIEAQLKAGRNAGDIIVLVQRRRPLVLPLIRALQRAGIAVAGLDRLTLSRHLAVRDVLALIACCLNPGDDLATAQVLRSPLIGVSEEELLALAYGRTGTLWAVADHPTLHRWRNARDMVPYDFLTLVLEESGTRVLFAERFGEEVHEVLDELKQQAAMMPPELPQTLAYFADWLAGSVREIKREVEGAGNAVRIMTVHGAKGLEAPVVLVADMGSQPTTKDEKHFFVYSVSGQLLPVLSLSDEAKYAPALIAAKETKKQALIAEYQRLLYVALTRPQAELHLFGMGNKKGAMGEGSWHETLRAALATLGAPEETGKIIHWNAGDPLASHAAVTMEQAPLPAWLKQTVKSEGIFGITAPSRLGENSAAQRSEYLGEGEDARSRGVRMHQLLELLGNMFDSEHLTQLLEYFAPDWDAAEKQKAAAEIRALFASHGWIWQGVSHAEVNITGTLTRNGISIPASGQIDRLVQTDQGWVVLDYKTGTHIPASAMQTPLSYRLQLKTYQQLVAQLYPGQQVRTAILWTHGCQLMWMDEAVDATPYEDVMFVSPVAA